MGAWKRCPWAIRYWYDLHTRCRLIDGHGVQVLHEGRGIRDLPDQLISWSAAYDRQYRTDRADEFAWRGEGMEEFMEQVNVEQDQDQQEQEQERTYTIEFDLIVRVSPTGKVGKSVGHTVEDRVDDVPGEEVPDRLHTYLSQARDLLDASVAASFTP